MGTGETPLMTSELRISTTGRLGSIVLDRPKAINALSLEMIEGIAAALAQWRDDPDIGAVLFEGAGEKGFCAGGDVRAARAHVIEGRPEDADRYFATDYRMNALIAGYPKPLVALTHGIVMGGGIGIAGHCGMRITQPGSRFAMPESAIGFFADVGVSAILAKAPLNRALLFLMSGVSVGASDALALGLADVVVPPSSAACIVDRMKARGTPVQACGYWGVDHSAIVPVGIGDAVRWIAGRRAGNTLEVCPAPLMAVCDAP